MYVLLNFVRLKKYLSIKLAQWQIHTHTPARTHSTHTQSISMCVGKRSPYNGCVLQTHIRTFICIYIIQSYEEHCEKISIIENYSMKKHRQLACVTPPSRLPSVIQTEKNYCYLGDTPSKKRVHTKKIFKYREDA